MPLPTPPPAPPPLRKPPLPVSGNVGRGLSPSDDAAGLLGMGGTEGASGIGNLRTYVPNQWMDLTDTKLPSRPHEVYELCRYLAATSPAHKTYVRNFSTLPVTEILVQNMAATSAAVQDAGGGANSAVRRNAGVIAVGGDAAAMGWADYLDRKIKLRTFLKEFAASACMYSAAVALVQRPFVKQTKCTHCGARNDLRLGNFQLLEGYLSAKMTCDSCEKEYQGPIEDVIVEMDRFRIRPVVMDMNNIRSLRNQFTGQVRLYYVIPEDEARAIEQYALYDHEMFLQYRQEYHQAIFSPMHHAMITDGTNRSVLRLRDEELFLWRSPFPPNGVHGLPIPDMVASFKETWLLRIYEKSSQATAAQGLNPFTILFPAPPPGGESLFQHINVSNYMPVIADSVRRHAQDPNYRAVMPFPVGQLTIGGEGKALTVHQEIRATMEMICAALGCPVEFLFGGMSYSGSNVSIKQVLALLQEMQTGLKDLAQWVSDILCDYLQQPGSYLIDMADLRIGDDLAYIGALSSMVSAGQLSMSRLHSELRVNHEAEKLAMRADVDFNNEMQEKRAALEAENQAKIMTMQAQGQGRGAGVAALAEINQAAENALAVRGDSKLMNFLLSDPNRAIQFLGANSQEVREHQSMVERTMARPVDPSMHGMGPVPVPAPTPAAEGGGDMDIDSRIAQNVAAFSMGEGEGVVEEEPDDMMEERTPEEELERLMGLFQQIDPDRWEEAFAVASKAPDVDPSVLQELRAKLDMSKAQYQAAMPDTRAGVRDPRIGGGGGL